MIYLTLYFHISSYIQCSFKSHWHWWAKCATRFQGGARFDINTNVILIAYILYYVLSIFLRKSNTFRIVSKIHNKYLYLNSQVEHDKTTHQQSLANTLSLDIASDIAPVISAIRY